MKYQPTLPPHARDALRKRVTRLLDVHTSPSVKKSRFKSWRGAVVGRDALVKKYTDERREDRPARRKRIRPRPKNRLRSWGTMRAVEAWMHGRPPGPGRRFLGRTRQERERGSHGAILTALQPVGRLTRRAGPAVSYRRRDLR